MIEIGKILDGVEGCGAEGERSGPSPVGVDSGEGAVAPPEKNFQIFA